MQLQDGDFHSSGSMGVWDSEFMKIPIHRGLIERNMIAGVPRKVAILGGTIGGALVLGMQNAWMILVLVPIYLILVVLYRSDPYLLAVLVTHVTEDDFLEP